MKKIRISTFSKDSTLLRQTPENTGVWKETGFHVDDGIEACDWWVVYDGMASAESALCPKERTIFVTGEPASIKKYNKSFLKQFGMIITSQREIKGKNVVYSHTSLPWSLGKRGAGKKLLGLSKDYDELKRIGTPEKTRLISIVTSNKSYTKGHRKRLAFVRRMQAHFGDRLDVFGPALGIADSEYDGIRFKYHEDKWDAVAPYKYHIAIENSLYEDYWTEKLADAFLAEAYPIYYGCPNAESYFDTDSFARIDIEKPGEAIEIIENAIRGSAYEKAVPSIARSKSLILERYNLFPMLDAFTDGRADLLSVPIIGITTIRPESEFKKATGIFGKILTAAKRALPFN